MLIPMSSPDLTALERQAVARVLDTPYLSMGDEIREFERAFCDYLSCRNAIGVNSGTAGLHLCVIASGVKERDVVITTPFSFVSSTNVILYERGVPVFVDVNAESGNIEPELVRQALQDIYNDQSRAQRWLPRRGAEEWNLPKAILMVDVFGQPCDADAVLAVAREYDLVVIEDACESLGAAYKGRLTGKLGDLAVFAFYPNKQITTGEGGMIVTDDDGAAERMRSLRNQGRDPGDTWLQHTYLGYNYRLDEMSAALGRVQMSRLEELLSRRQQVADWYRVRLERIPGVMTPRIAPSTTRMSWFVYVVRFEAEVERDRVAKALEERNIPTRPYFTPIHLQKYMKERFGYREGDYPVAEDLGRRGLALPFSGVMTEEQVELVCNNLRAVL